MSTKVLWLFTFVALYWGYCLFWGFTTARTAKTASGFFIAGRGLTPWVFLLAVTAASFAGWTFVGNPGLVFRDGFQYAYVAFAAIAIPLTGVVFFKRQWMLGKRFGYVTPAEMLSDYFRGDTIRLLVVLVAVLFAIPFLGVQLRASGFLFQVLTDGMVGIDFGMWVLAVVLFAYVALGGLRAVAYVGTLQFLFLAGGIIALGIIAYVKLGGFGPFNEALAALGMTDIGRWGATADGYNAYFAIPGVIQFTAGLGRETPVGGLWTGVMILTYMLALMGVQSAPSFSMWAFASKDPRPFAPQQVWASAAVIGGILIFFSTVQGMGAHFLGASPAVTDAGLAISNVLPDLGASGQADLVPYYINLIGETSPWFLALLAVGALAAMQSSGAAHMSTTGGMLARDLYKRFLNPTADHATQIRFGRIGAGVIILLALALATFSVEGLAWLGGLALAVGFQMWPSLAAVCWFPWITREGAITGLVAGLLAVLFTESFGVAITGFLGLDLPWGRWPWTIHSAAWGMFFNLGFCLIVSAMTQNEDGRRHRMKFHSFLAEHAKLPVEKAGLRPVAWGIVLIWCFLGVGPGAVIGNTLFGAPNGGLESWSLGIPSIWGWQMLWWALGVLMLWFLAYKMELSTAPAGKVEALAGDIGDKTPETLSEREINARWQWFWALVVGVMLIAVLNWAFG